MSILGEGVAGLPVTEVCRKHGISMAAYQSRWRGKVRIDLTGHQSMLPNEAARGAAATSASGSATLLNRKRTGVRSKWQDHQPQSLRPMHLENSNDQAKVRSWMR